MTEKQRHFIESLCSQLGCSLQYALDTAKVGRMVVIESLPTWQMVRNMDSLSVDEASELIEWLLAEKGGSR
ncbi:MAG: hypothetical protein IMY86_13750 [Chloroflexi bacterium]|nr:hypothetical protein [Chloroflexota bacterium]